MDTVDTPVDTVDTRRRKYNRITITLHLVPGKDDDLIRIFSAIPMGQRANVLKKAIRGKQQLANEPQQPAPELQDIRARVEWLQNAMTDLPGFVERLVQQVAHLPKSAAPQPETADIVDNATLQERAKKLKARKW